MKKQNKQVELSNRLSKVNQEITKLINAQLQSQERIELGTMFTPRTLSFLKDITNEIQMEDNLSSNLDSYNDEELITNLMRK